MATLKELAEAAGVSIRTVARTLQKTGPVSAETRSRVERAAQELGYRANLAARSLRRQSNGTVALLASEDASHSFMSQDLLEGISRGLRDSRYSLSLRFVRDKELSDPARLRDLVSELGVDGLLIHYPHALPAEAEAVLSRFDLPVVWTNRNPANNAVFPDDYGAARLAVEKLASETRGKTIAYCHFLSEEKLPLLHFSAKERSLGYRDAMAALGLQPWILRPDQSGPGWTGGEDYLRKTFGQPGHPEALLAYSEVEAAAFLRAAAGLGLEIPMIAFTPRDTEWALPRVRRLVVPEENLGLEASRLLLAKMETPSIPLPSLRISYGDPL